MARRCALVFVLLLVARAAQAGDAQMEAVLAACRQPGNPLPEGRCNLLFGLADIESGNADAARLHLHAASQRFEAAGDPVGAWKALWVLYEYENRFGRRPDLRVAVLEEALAVLARAKRPDLQLLEAVSRDRYCDALLNMGEIEKAETQLGIASQLARPFSAMLDRSIARSMGQLRRRQWRLDEARESYLKALAAPKDPVPFTVDDRGEGDMVALYGLTEIEMLGGRTDQALGWNDRALSITRAAGEREAELKLLEQRAAVLERGGRSADAEQLYANALSLAQAYGDVKQQAMLLSNRAFMFLDRGRYAAAIADGEKAAELIAAIDDPLLESALLAQLAQMYSGIGAGEGAASAIEKARPLGDRKGARVGKALLDVIAASDTGTPEDLNKAFEHLMQLPEMRGLENMPQLAALLRAVTGPNPAVDVNALDRSHLSLDGASELLEVAALLDQSRFPAAREAAMRALARDPNAELRTYLLAIIALTYGGEGQLERCIDYATKAADAFDAALDAVPVDDLLGGFLDAKRTVFDMLIDLFVMTNHTDQAFDVTERARARAFLQMVGNHRIAPRSAEGSPLVREAEALRTQIAQWQQQARVAPTKELEDDLHGARRRYAGLMTRIKASNPEYASMTSVQPPRLDEIRNELPAHTTLISYFITTDSVHAWVLDRTALQYVSLPFDRAVLEGAECTANQFLAGGRGIRLDGSCRTLTAEQLYGRLFAPLRAYIHNPRLIIVPHGVLHYLPFGALRDPATNRYLIEDYTITYAPSAGSIRFLRDKETPVNGKALVIGAPAGVSPELPGAMREAIMVGNELHCVPVVGSAAKESLLYHLNGDVDLVHIAAHGFYDADTPLFSRLALAAGDGSDGNLEVHEILSGVDLTGVNLVVLSACQTALGKVSAGDEIVGLTRALLYAGTPGVISTLWNIDDDAAAALMSDFYCALLNGESAADALRHAQLQLLHGDYPDPRQWAAFTLNGDPEGRWNH